MSARPLVIVATTPLEAALLENTERLRRTCRRLAGDPAAADDLFQETWIRALSRPPTDLEADLGPWLDRVARNLSIDRYRRSSREQLDETPEQHAAAEAPRHPAVIRQEAGRAWLIAMSSLGPVQRAVLLLRAVLDMDTNETAELLGMSPGAVRTRLHRARQQLAGQADAAPDDLKAVLAELVDARVSSVGDVAMLGRAGGSWRRLWIGPAGALVWRALLELLVISAGDSAGSRAYLAYLQGAEASQDERQDDARALLEEAHARATELGEDRLIWVIRHEQAAVGLRAFDPDMVDDALEALGDTPVRSASHRTWLSGARANRAFRSGDADAAAEISAEVLRKARAPYWRHRLQANMALYENQQGDLHRAMERVDKAIQSLVGSGDPEALATAWNTRGMILQNLADFDGAEAAFHRSVDLLEQAFGRRQGYQPMGNLALLRIEQGRLEEAWALLTDAQKRNATANHRSTAINLANRAVVALMDENPALAAELLDAAIEIADRIQEWRFLAHASALRAAARGLLGADPAPDLAVADQHAQGSQLDIIDAYRALSASRAAPDAARQTLRRLQSSGERHSCTARIALILLQQSLPQNPLSRWEVSRLSQEVFAHLGLSTVEDLIQIDEATFLAAAKQLAAGRRSAPALREVKEILADQGLHLAR